MADGLMPSSAPWIALLTDGGSEVFYPNATSEKSLRRDLVADFYFLFFFILFSFFIGRFFIAAQNFGSGLNYFCIVIHCNLIKPIKAC